MAKDGQWTEQARRVAGLRHEVEFYELLLAERRELLLEAEYRLGVIVGRSEGRES